MMQSPRELISWEKVHIFVSSTFNDMHADRDYMVKRVFPELQDWCERRKLRLVDIDLRWGVTEQDATHNKNVVKVCLNRIDDCRPFFLCFLGQRRGWVPLEDEVSAETFEAFPDLRSVVGAASVTEMEILHALINPLHRSLPHDNTKPAERYEPSKYSFFYLRDPSYLNQLPVDPPQLRETYTNEWIENDVEREEQDLTLKRWREVDIPASNRPFDLYEAKWDPSAATPELALPLQCSSTEPANIDRWRKPWQKAGVTVTGLNIEDDRVETNKARDFNIRLSTGRLTQFECEGAPLSKRIIRQLQEAIADRYPHHSEVEHESELQKEIDQQGQFLFSASEGFIEREGDFAELDDYVESDSNNLFVLTAAGGMGKSTLLANWVDRYRRRIEGRADHSIHFRFIGQSDGTTTPYSVLRLLLGEIKEVVHKFDEEIPLDPVKLRNEWPALLEAIGKRGKTVIVLDALNQLDSGLTDVGWLPRQLPHNIKLIVSFKRGDPAAEQLYERFSEGNQVRLSEVKPFENLDDRRRLVRAYLSQYLKELDAAHLEALINLRGAENPLYLKVVLSELRVFGAYGNLAAKIGSDFGDDPVSAFVRVLDRLENDPAYSPIDPKQAVPLLFGLLAHARRGLSVDELTSLFIQAQGLDDTDQWREAAADTVNLFLRQVRSFLARREGRYDFFFDSFKIAAQQCFVATDAEKTISKRSYQEWHWLLASYFKRLPTWQEAAPSSELEPARQPTRRKVVELPHHLICAEQWEDVEETLCDLGFVKAKCAARLVFELQGDYRNALRFLPENEPNIRDQQERETRFARWTAELMRYSQAWREQITPMQKFFKIISELTRYILACRKRQDRKTREQSVGQTERTLREIPSSCRMWTEGEIANECRRIIEYPTRLDRLTAFAAFVGAECYSLLQFGQFEGFVPQHAWSHAPQGPIHAAAAKMLPDCLTPILVCRWPQDAVYNPKPALLLTLEGHSDLVGSVSVTADGRRVVSGSFDKTLRVWDLENGACLRILEGHRDFVTGVSVTSDGRLVVSGSFDKTLRVWDLENGACLRTLEGHSDLVTSVSVTADGRRAVSGSCDKTLRVWDLESGACLRTLEGHMADVMSVSVTPDGRRALSGSREKTLRVWDLESGACLRTLEGHSGQVMSASVTPDGRYAVSGSTDNTLRVWDLESGACLRTLASDAGAFSRVSVTPDGRRAVSGADKTLRVWDLESGACLRTLEGHSAAVESVNVMTDGRGAVSGSDDNTLRVWDLESGACLPILAAHKGEVSCLSATRYGRRLVSGSWDTSLRVWDLHTGVCQRTLEGHTSGIRSVSVTSDDRRAVSGSDDNALRVWDLESGECLRALEGHDDGVMSVSVTPDAQRAVSGSVDKTLQVWDLESGARLNTLKGHNGVVSSVSVTPDGQRAVSGSLDTTLRVWDLETGACLRTLAAHNKVRSVSVTPDGRRVVSGSLDSSLQVWDLESGACLRTLEGHSTKVESVSVSPDGRRAVSGSRDKSLRIWDLESGQCLGVYVAAAAIFSVVVIGRGNTICAGSAVGEVLFLDVRGIEPGPDFGADASDETYELLLRRGLEFASRQKGDNHVETLAHLDALAVHLQKMGKPA